MGDRCSLVTLSSYQKGAIQRIAGACRSQYGHLIYHRMGAGKTLTALTTLYNMDKSVPRTVFAPASVLRDTFSPDSKDAAKLFPVKADRIAFFSTLKVHALESMEEMYSTNELAAVLRNHVVLIDEAHNLIPILRADDQRGNELVRMLRSAKRLLLMTGTPIMRDVGDIGLMLQLVGRYSYTDMPSQVSLFKNVFYQIDRGTSWSSWAESMRGWMYPMGGFLTSKMFDLLGIVLPFTYAERLFASASSVGTLWTALQNWTVSDSTGALGKLVAGAVSLGVWNALLPMVRGLELESLNTEKFLPKALPFISFFDYEDASAEEAEVVNGQHIMTLPRMFFPRKEIINKFSPINRKDLPIIAVSLYQSQLLLAFCANKMTLNQVAALGMERVVGSLSNDRVTDAARADTTMDAVFKEWACALGNVSEDMETYTTRWNDGSEDVLTQSFIAVRRDGKGKAAVPATVFACPKFDWVVERLKQLKQSRTLAPCWKVAPSGEFLRSASGEKILDEGHVFLPVVYSTYEDAGFCAFSAYLAARGHKHVVYLGGERDAKRKARIDAAAMATPYLRTDPLGPLCVLIHPSIKEGVSFTQSPALIVMEPIRGFGVQEQVYGRVLRRYPGLPELRDMDRPMKTIVQVSMGYDTVAIANYYKAAFQHYKKFQTAYAPTPILMYLGQHMDTTPDDTVMQLNMSGGKVIEALAAAFKGRKDSDVTCAVDDTRLQAQQKCHVCMSGVCNCSNTSCPSVSLGRDKRERMQGGDWFGIRQVK